MQSGASSSQVRSGEELVADQLVVEDGPLAFSYRGVCGYGTTFDYSG